MVLTFWQTQIYADEETIYTDTIQRNPACWMAYSNLGIVLLDKDRPQEAVERFEQALAIKPDLAEAEHNLGNALVNLGRAAEALAHYERAAQLKPDVPAINHSLGRALLHANRPRDAVPTWRRPNGPSPTPWDSRPISAQRCCTRAHPRGRGAVGAGGRARTKQRARAQQPGRRPAQSRSRAECGWTNSSTPRSSSRTTRRHGAIWPWPTHSSSARPKQSPRPSGRLNSARSQGNGDLAARIEAWLTKYREGKTTPIQSPASPALPPP